MKFTPLEVTLFKILGVIILGSVSWYVTHVETVSSGRG